MFLFQVPDFSESLIVKKFVLVHGEGFVSVILNPHPVRSTVTGDSPDSSNEATI